MTPDKLLYTLDFYIILMFDLSLIQLRKSVFGKIKKTYSLTNAYILTGKYYDPAVAIKDLDNFSPFLSFILTNKSPCDVRAYFSDTDYVFIASGQTATVSKVFRSVRIKNIGDLTINTGLLEIRISNYDIVESTNITGELHPLIYTLSETKHDIADNATTTLVSQSATSRMFIIIQNIGTGDVYLGSTDDINPNTPALVFLRLEPGDVVEFGREYLSSIYAKCPTGESTSLIVAY